MSGEQGGIRGPAGVPEPAATEGGPAGQGPSAPPAVDVPSRWGGPAEPGADDRSRAAPALERRFRILGLLGHGGMADVFLAHDRDLDREVALKVMRGEGAILSFRFVEEARVLGRLEHPNIVAIHDAGVTADGRAYYTMPLVRGHTLRQVLNELAGPRAAEAVRLWTLTRLMQVFQQVASAVHFAHTRGVIHRDLKPGNVMCGEHGQVFLLDWGLARIGPAPAGAAAEPAPEEGRGDTSLTTPGSLVGTPRYMAPEQAQGQRVDARADVYSLGCVLYEVLTLERVFDGDTVQVLSAHVGRTPLPPASRAPGRSIPLELERLCLSMLAKDPALRPQSAATVAEAVQHWLEGEAERERRVARAAERAAEGTALLAACREREAEAHRLESEAAAAAGAVDPWRPVADKQPGLGLEDRARAERARLGVERGQAVTALTEAVSLDPDNRAARAGLAGYFWSQYLAAEAAGDPGQQEYYARLIDHFDDGRLAPLREGAGSLQLDSDPPGAEAWIHRLEERALVLRPDAGRSLGRTPLGPLPLARGSYLVRLRLEGRRETLYPVWIPRGRDWRGTVRLPRGEQVGEGFVHVPAGPFRAGGDPRARGRTGPVHEREVADFCLAVHPVTMGEYVEFLRDLGRRDLGQMRRRSPRHGPEGASILPLDDDGLPVLPEVDRDGDRWDPRWPVFMVSAADAEAYAAWRSARDGRPCRLPDEWEWEKAARGVDGRAFPWGDRFDPSLCNMRESLPGRSLPVSVDEFPDDRSVYGVRGLAGNVQDWTASAIAIGRGEGGREGRVIRGGAWDYSEAEARLAGRDWNMTYNVTHLGGFRLAHDLWP